MTNDTFKVGDKVSRRSDVFDVTEVVGEVVYCKADNGTVAGVAAQELLVVESAPKCEPEPEKPKAQKKIQARPSEKPFASKLKK